MEPEGVVLVVHEDITVLPQLREILRRRGIQTQYASNCTVARCLMSRTLPPEIVFTGTGFRDGTWQDVLAMGRALKPPATVVLVTRQDEIKLYLDAMEDGAFDYVVPPFSSRDILRIIESVTLHRSLIGNNGRAQTKNA